MEITCYRKIARVTEFSILQEYRRKRCGLEINSSIRYIVFIARSDWDIFNGVSRESSKLFISSRFCKCTRTILSWDGASKRVLYINSAIWKIKVMIHNANVLYILPWRKQCNARKGRKVIWEHCLPSCVG